MGPIMITATPELPDLSALDKANSIDELKDSLNQLKDGSKKDTILILHHHLIKDQFTTPSVDIDDNFEKIIRESSLVGIFVGHTHHPFNGSFADKPYFSTGSLSFIGHDEGNGIVRFEENAQFSICTYEDGKISVEVISASNDNKLLGIVNFKE